MTTRQYHRRPFAGESDLPRLGDLIAACQAVDQLASPHSIQDLRDELLEPTAGWTREVVVWEGDAEPGALACLWVPPASETQGVFLWFWVHPAARNGDLSREVIAWGDERGGALAGHEAQLTVGAREEEAWRLTLFPTLGFTPVRYFLQMSKRLDDPLPVASPPNGYEIRPLIGTDEVDAWVDLHNVAFTDHWEHHEITAEERRVGMERPSYRPDLDLVAVAPDGTLAAYCWGEIRDLDDGSVEAWIQLVGTHPAHRRRGLARCLIAAGLAGLRAYEMTAAKLSVDAESPTGATSLYESLGFTVVKTVTAFRRPVRSANARETMSAGPAEA